jgi:preprotein translocase subunit SecF
MSDHHKFRYLIAPGTNFAFVSKFKTWFVLSCLLMAISIGALFFNKSYRGEYMNWTIDFKGGTEIIYAFQDKSTHASTKVDPAQVRQALAKAGEGDIEVSEISWKDENEKQLNGMIVRTPRFSAIAEEAKDKTSKDFLAKFKDKGALKAAWSGDRLTVYSKQLIKPEDVGPFLAGETYEKADDKGTKTTVPAGLELKPWLPEEQARYEHADEGTKEFQETFTMWGLDRQFGKDIEAAVPNVDAQVYQSYGVGAKAGDKLRDDAAKSIVYALFLIMLYLAFRFDIRYAPGAAFATVHDAVMVIGVFALTWTEVSLTSVAGLLTVMGYSTNDTVIVFDRIRENQAKLKDKKIERIVDISLNEMLVRTILTSSTVFATTLIMNIFGTGDVRNFAFAMNIGVIVGTYSSIFLASPVFMWISRKWYSGPVKKRAVPASAVGQIQPDTSAE